MDERQSKIMGKAMGITLAIVYVYVLISCIYVYVTTFDVSKCAWQLGVLILIPVCFLIFSREDESLMLPRTVKNEEMSPEETEEAKKSRVRGYTIEALLFSAAMLGIDIVVTLMGGLDAAGTFQVLGNLSKTASYILCGLIAFVLMFVISFGIDYFWGEHKVRKYNEMLQKMEDEE